MPRTPTPTRKPVKPRYSLSDLRTLSDQLRDDVSRATSFLSRSRVKGYTRSIRTLPPDRLRFSSSLLKSYRSLRSAHSLSFRPTTCPTTYDRRILIDMRRLAADILSR